MILSRFSYLSWDTWWPLRRQGYPAGPSSPKPSCVCVGGRGEKILMKTCPLSFHKLLQVTCSQMVVYDMSVARWWGHVVWYLRQSEFIWSHPSTQGKVMLGAKMFNKILYDSTIAKAWAVSQAWLDTLSLGSKPLLSTYTVGSCTCIGGGWGLEGWENGAEGVWWDKSSTLIYPAILFAFDKSTTCKPVWDVVVWRHKSYSLNMTNQIRQNLNLRCILYPHHIAMNCIHWKRPVYM